MEAHVDPNDGTEQELDEELEGQDGNEEEAEQSDEEAAESLRKGFEKVAPQAATDDPGEDEGDDDEDAAEQQRQADEAERARAAADPNQKLLSELPDKLRRMDGAIGGAMAKLDQVLAKFQGGSGGDQGAGGGGGGNAPSGKEVAAALANPEKMKDLLEVYPDFQPLADEVAAVRAELAKLAGGGMTGADGKPLDEVAMRKMVEDRAGAIADTKIERAMVSMQRPGWEKVVVKPEFIDFALAGGPTREQYAAFLKLPDGSTEQRQQLYDWSIAHPKWWTARGAKLNSPAADDAVSLVKAFDDHVSGKGGDGAGDREARRRRNQERLKRAAHVATKGGGAQGAQDPSEQERFRAGFKKVAGNRVAGR